MIRMIKDTYTDDTEIREVTFSYNYKTDETLLKNVLTFISDNQPECTNCKNYHKSCSLGGYSCSECKIHGNLEYFKHPHHDMDGSKCDDYVRREG